MAETFDSVCRLCADKVTHECLDIFGEFGINARVSEILFQHFGIEALINDGNSSRICPQCWSITDNFHNLYETVQQSESQLIEYANETTTTLDICRVVKLDTAELDDHDANTSSTAHDGTIIPVHDSQYKIEILDKNETMLDGSTMLMEINVNVDDDKDVGVKPELVSYLEDDDGDGDAIKEEDDNENVDDDFDDDEDDGDDIEDDDHDDEDSDFDEEGNRNAAGRRKVRSAADTERIERENEQIRQYYNMNCSLCSVVFRTIQEAVKHYRRGHQQTGYLKCCNKKVYRRCMALDHIQKHLDPDLHRCPQCNKVYTNKSTLRSHMRRHKDIEAQLFVCDQCPERYATLQALAKHKRLEHNDAGSKEFGCDICGKFFVTKSVLANHIRGVHENAFAHMCHICAKTFKSKQVYDLHQREHLDTEPPKLQCSICGNWLKHEHSLRKHMARHGQTEEVCKLCNKVAPNRHALGNHMRYVHSERSYKCTMCEKAFKKPIGLKEHMASHMGVDLYFCPYCPKTFKSNANMHSHRKKKHLAQWQHDREQRQKP